MDQQTEILENSSAASFDFNQFSFGETPTDHLFLASYQSGEWNAGNVKPFCDFRLSPFSLGLHYGQTVFEGMRAFRLEDGNISIFRPDRHFERMNKSLHRMCMPSLPEHLFYGGLRQLIHRDQQWLPANREDISLYIRPFVFASEARLGVKVAEEYQFAIVCTPIGQYYSQPLCLKLETSYVRAAEGGAGYAKCSGNYGGAFYPAWQARLQGFDQVVWTDSRHHEYLEECGTMNIFLVLNNQLLTPALSSSILDGVTRDSLLQIAKAAGYAVGERKISYKELQNALEKGERVEIFGAGTAALISPVKSIHIHGKTYETYHAPDALMYHLKECLQAIRLGKAADSFGWNYLIKDNVNAGAI